MASFQAPMPQMYGTVGDFQLAKPRKDRTPLNLMSIIGMVFVPWLTFITVAFIRSAELHYSSDSLSCGMCLLILLVILGIGTSSLTSSSPRSPVLSFMIIFCIVAWTVGYLFGDYNFTTNFGPYFDINNLNTYPSVDPSSYRGQQLMDAGVIDFVPGSHLDLSKSYGFKNGDIYCIAPILGPDRKAGDNKTQSTYDFWAVGLNCCSGHIADYHCGEYTNPNSHKGLRLMRDDQRSYFRLAVEEAKAAYNIEASHPVFMYWMQFPTDEVNAHYQDGSKYIMQGAFAFLAFMLSITAMALFCIM